MADPTRAYYNSLLNKEASVPIDSKPSGLREALAAAGARFVTHRGREVPEEFSGADEEYRAARDSVVVGDRSYRARVRVTGRDRVSFLQNMLTNDVKGLAKGAGLPAAHLSRLGKLVSDLIVYQLGDAVLLEMEPEGLKALMDSLSHYVVSEDVALSDVSNEEALFSIDGPRSLELLGHLLDDGLPELAPLHFTQARLGSQEVRISASRHGPGPGFDVGVVSENAAEFLDKLLESGRPLALRLAGWRALEIRRVEAGIPVFGVDMDDSHLPLEAGLDETISFTKGCYIGQEYVVRLAHRGHLNRKLVGLEMSDASVPRSGDEIRGADHRVGQLTSAVFSPTLGHPIAMGYVHRDCLTPGTPVSILSGGNELAALVTELPFIRWS
jgi:folate-binding protein YgfZ